MARRATTPARIYGPQRHGNRYRLTIRDGGENTYRSFETEKEALGFKREFVKQLQGEVALEEVFERYEEHLKRKGNKDSSVTTTMFRLRRFVGRTDLTVRCLTPAWGKARYAALVEAQAADTHRNSLAEMKTFCRWLVKEKILKLNPLLEVEGTGKRRHGKEQLRINEARRWLAAALELAEKGEVGAVAAMVTLLLGLRCCEVVSRVVRDLDDDGRLLWIPDSKTEAGKRTQEVPEVLKPYLTSCTKDKLPTAPLFGEHTRAWPRKWVQKICKLAKVPQVTAHGMRGLYGTLGIATNQVPHAVAASLGHESESTTFQSYAKPEALAGVKAKRALMVLTGAGA